MFAAIPIILASVAAASNFFTSPVANTTVNAGEVLKLRWIDITGDNATLFLKNGDASDLKNVTTIVENTPNNGAIDWTVPSDLTTGSYAIEIDANGEINYSTFFTIVGKNITSSSSSQVNSTTSSPSTSSYFNSTYFNSTSTQVPRTNVSSISSTPVRNASVTSSGSSFHSSKISTRASSTSASRTGNSTTASGHANGAPRSNGYSAIALFFTIVAAFFLL